MSGPLGAAGARIDVVADLAVEVDGTPVRVTADGTEVLVAVSDPAVVLDAVSSVPGVVGLDRRGVRRGLASLADRAAAAGLGVVVTGPDGVLVTVGPHARPTRWSRLLTGSDRVGFGAAATVRGPVVAVARRRIVDLRPRLLRVAPGLVAAAVVAAVVRRRAHRG